MRETESIPASIINLTIGTTFAGRYRITQELGHGGMGVVYKAEDIKLKRPVALKFLHWELTRDEAAKERFIHEAQAASALDDSNICTIYEVDETQGGQMFIAMAYCEGESLKKKVERGALEIGQALDIAILVCQGLAAAHEAGMIHRDIKPANIMVSDRGHVRIVDFGLAKLAGQTRLTRTGMVVGTVAYMSPEQAHGDEVDSRTDIWSVGVVLYEMLTGRLPFRGGHDQAIIHSILQDQPERITKLTASIPADIERVVLACLRKDAGERYATVCDLEADLRQIRGDTAASTTGYYGRTTARTMSAIRPGRMPRHLAGITLIGAAVGALILLSLLPPGRPLLTGRIVKQWLGISVVPEARYVAVLPFTVTSMDPRHQALCDGLVDVNTSKLTRIAPLTNSLWVVPASEVSHRKITSPEEAQRVLNVNLAVTGRVVCYGDTVDMAVDLVDTKRLRRLKHFTVSEPMANLSIWQDSLIMHMTRMLEVKLEPAKYSFLKVGCSSVPSAYRSYLRGCGYLASFALEPQVDSAIVAFNQAIAEDPSFAQAYVAMGEAYWRRGYAAKATGSIERAIICCDQAIKLNDQLPGAFSLRGKCEAQMHQYDNAIRDFGRAVQLDSDCFEAYEGMGTTYYDGGKYDLAAGAYWEAVRVRPESYGTYYWLGKAYIDNGEYDKAIKPFEAMIELRPRQAPGYGCLGLVYFNKDNWPEAKKMFLKSLALDTLGYVCSDLATIYFYEGRYADAAALCKKGLEKVLEKPIDHSKEFRSVGMYAESCYWMPGQRDSSLALFQTATNMAEKQLAENPDDAGILAYLASYHSMMGNRAKAQAYLNEAESRAPTDKDVAFRIGETYERLGERERALMWIGKALDGGLPLTYVELPPGLSSLRSDERFPRLRQTYRLRDRR